ncbi:hypothetical protein LTR70_006751 [Exophiala xenobiotica]|uniref:magnesium chelatase n=1 Tax=Lithohypha guttulata TaxID=1690604 RepID=A0ABR0KBD0_9EURO|nr:hypothetical protein LTR24_005017 [Lithohypha guttulata]KAK5315412.1 hypothetical protein LTR70_006751 [Exophiala xenobiotica]
MDVQNLLDNIQELSDLELGVLLSLIAQGHCLMTTEDDLVDDLANELSLIVSERFGLSYVVLEPDDFDSIDRFGESILEERGTQFTSEDDPQPGSLRARLTNIDIRSVSKSVRRSSRDDGRLDDRMIKNVVIAKGFNFADEYVQIQAIEIINNKRFLSPSSKDIRLIPHLNDDVFISHYHLAEHGFANLEELDHSVVSDGSSGPSKQRSSWESTQRSRLISKGVIDEIRSLGEAAAITPEVRRYLQDIITFLRLERGVDGGITPRATTQFVALAQYLAPLHGIDFVTPSLVMLAARKVYPHRVIIAEPARERSTQYGSEPGAVAELLQDLTPELVIEEVLNTVQCPI